MAKALEPGRSSAFQKHAHSAILAVPRSDSVVDEVSHDLSSQHPFPAEYSMLNLDQKLAVRSNLWTNRSPSSQSESLSQIPSLSQLRDLNQSPYLDRMNTVAERSVPGPATARFPESDLCMEHSFEISISRTKAPPMKISEAVLEEQSSNEESNESQSQIKNYLKRRASKNQAAAAYSQPPRD
jgi:hypothetical protein